MQTKVYSMVRGDSAEIGVVSQGVSQQGEWEPLGDTTRSNFNSRFAEGDIAGKDRPKEGDNIVFIRDEVEETGDKLNMNEKQKNNEELIKEDVLKNAATVDSDESKLKTDGVGKLRRVWTSSKR